MKPSAVVLAMVLMLISCAAPQPQYTNFVTITFPKVNQNGKKIGIDKITTWHTMIHTLAYDDKFYVWYPVYAIVTSIDKGPAVNENGAQRETVVITATRWPFMEDHIGDFFTEKGRYRVGGGEIVTKTVVLGEPIPQNGPNFMEVFNGAFAQSHANRLRKERNIVESPAEIPTASTGVVSPPVESPNASAPNTPTTR